MKKGTIQLKDPPTKVYAIGAKLILSKVPLEVPSYIGKSTGSNKRSVPINRPVSSNWKQRVSTNQFCMKVGLSKENEWTISKATVITFPAKVQ